MATGQASLYLSAKRREQKCRIGVLSATLCFAEGESFPTPTFIQNNFQLLNLLYPLYPPPIPQ